ncbi:MAG TPA: carboxypeptidase regulatory-like domain-containing protein, partial [Vicinamibacterales bacterium]|nr:carboxypeptidase regulatory-like domain-containing protein [Vicinamibacterales bacterium]
MRIAALMVIASCLQLSAEPQTPAPMPRPAQIQGRVVAAEDGRPLVRARIALLSSAAPGRPLMTTSTNAQGNYHLRDVPPGSYFVSASRPGYIEQQYGQRRARERGLSVDVKAGATIERIDVALVRGAVLAGRVVDEHGEPYPGLLVTAWQMRYQEGRRVRFPAAFDQTDDQGAYRISGLQPGSYYLSAASPETWRNEKNETFGYAAAYYPGASADDAQPIALDAGQQRLSVDLSLAAARTSRLRGRIVRETREPAAGIPVAISPSIRGTGLSVVSGSPISSTTGADGSFELRDVPPGFYTIRSAAGGDARLSIDVAGDLDNLLLVSRSGSTVTGAVVTDTGEPPPFTASGARLSLISPTPENALPTVRVPAINSDWTFTLNSLGGPFLFRLSGFPSDWMLDAVRLGDDEVTDVPFDVPTGGKQITGLRIVITKETGTIAGNVLTEKGTTSADALVVVFSEDARHWIYGSRFIRMARPTAAGAYSISGLP